MKQNLWQYHAGLDGLRTVAVFLVILFHAGFSTWVNGFIGVDVFFVLSGFLVTNVLLHEYQKNGKIDLINFFAKRIRRLLPGAFTMIAVTLMVFWFFGSPVLFRSYLRGAQAGLLYHANFFQIWQSNDYFASSITESPFLHFWSLSIEEQFYFIFPFVLIPLLILKGKVGWKLPLAILTFLMSISLSMQLFESDELAAYYSSFTRFYQILAGVVLAFFTVNVSKEFAPKKSVTSVALIGLALMSLNTSLPIAISGVIATILTLAILSNLSFPKILEASPIVYLGKISYGMYLWHWPIMVFTRQRFTENVWVVFFIGFIGSILLATMSYYTVEAYFRNMRPVEPRAKRNNVYLGLIASFLGFVALIGVNDAISSNFWVSLGANRVNGYNCDQDIIACQSPITNFNAETSVVLLGDSHANMIANVFEGWASENNLAFHSHALGSCPWVRGITLGTPGEARNELCGRSHDQIRLEVLESSNPEVIFLFSRVAERGTSNDFTFVGEAANVAGHTEGNERWDEYYERIGESVDFYHDLTGAHIVIVQGVPIDNNGFESGRPVLNQPICVTLGHDDCSYPAEETRTNEMIDEQNLKPYVSVVSFNDLICPKNTCSPYHGENNEILVRRDRTHLTGDFVIEMQDEFIDILDSAFESP